MSINTNNNNGEKYESINDVPVNQKLLNALKDAGASRLLVSLVRIDPDDVGVGRNSVRQEVRKYCYWSDEISPEVIREKRHYGGGFFQNIWDGNFQKARKRADSNNKELLKII